MKFILAELARANEMKSYSDLFIFCASGEVFAIRAEAETTNIKVAHFSSSIVNKYAKMKQ